MRFKKGQRVVVDHCNEGYKTPRFQFYIGRIGVVQSVIVQSEPSYGIKFQPPWFNGQISEITYYFESELRLAEIKQPEEWL